MDFFRASVKLSTIKNDLFQINYTAHDLSSYCSRETNSFHFDTMKAEIIEFALGK